MSTLKYAVKSGIPQVRKLPSKPSAVECDDDSMDIDIESIEYSFNISSPVEEKDMNVMADPDSNKAKAQNTDKDRTIEAEDNNISFNEDSNEESSMDYNLSYVEKCFHDITNGDFLRKLLELLHKFKCLQDFMTLLELLVSGELSPLNIAFLLCLERAKWQECKNTSGMRYKAITRQFWEIVYRDCKGVTINLFGGRKNRTDVVAQRTERGYYDPRNADVNFAVPDKRILQKGKFLCQHERPPSIFEDVLKRVDTQKEYILS